MNNKFTMKTALMSFAVAFTASALLQITYYITNNEVSVERAVTNCLGFFIGNVFFDIWIRPRFDK